MPYTKKAIATRRRIVENAANLIFSQGYTRTKLEQVLLAANVQKGNFYYYFESKDDLGLAVIREFGRSKVLEWLESVVTDDADPWENITELVMQITQSPEVIKGHGNPVSNLALELSGVSDDFRREIDGVVNAVIDVFADQFDKLRQAGRLEPGSDARELASYLFSLVEGSMMHYKVTRNSEILRSNLQLGMRVIRNSMQRVSQD
ncbi:MAG: TetR/AcrR family transcriptional regulator [Planctomycetales bacterium]|nr:TetR/AcrR family transcriptional regulator [bacterium]UNM07625.1 MAG: TetR/AcrR family transcriptional regulator [Planctomycetales bacterium]